MKNKSKKEGGGNVPAKMDHSAMLAYSFLGYNKDLRSRSIYL